MNDLIFIGFTISISKLPAEEIKSNNNIEISKNTRLSESEPTNVEKLSNLNQNSGNQSIGNSVKIEGRGSTGRTKPLNLKEQIAMEQVKSNPLNGATNTGITMNDLRWSSSEGWSKMQSVIYHSDGTKTVIHFDYNPNGNLYDDFKFK